MQRTKVKSSNIMSVGWEKGELEVEFLSGDVYRYENVSEGVFKALMQSESKGRYFSDHVKRGGYVHRRVETSASRALSAN